MSYATSTRLTLWPNWSPIQWVLEAFPSEVKGPERKADYSYQSGAEIKNAACIRLSGVVLRHQDKFTFTFLPVNTLTVVMLV